MVKEVKRPDGAYYVCPECGLAYREERWARACQEFCSQHQACSLEITRHAVESTKIVETRVPDGR